MSTTKTDTPCFTQHITPSQIMNEMILLSISCISDILKARDINVVHLSFSGGGNTKTIDDIDFESDAIDSVIKSNDRTTHSVIMASYKDCKVVYDNIIKSNSVNYDVRGNVIDTSISEHSLVDAIGLFAFDFLGHLHPNWFVGLECSGHMDIDITDETYTLELLNDDDNYLFESNGDFS